MRKTTEWVDQVVDINTREVIQEGTDQSAGNFNNMENGINDAHIAQMIMMQGLYHLMRAAETEEQTVTLTNSKADALKVPFNNSARTVALATGRDTTNYDVDIEVLGKTGNGLVGEFAVTDKMLNGFKVAYDGSAASVTVKLTIKGGSN